MTAHLPPQTQASHPVAQRRVQGQRSFLAGAAAEARVEQHYVEGGCTLLRRRWRGGRAEIDMILRDGETLVFVEVKAARTHDAAITRLRPAQAQRIMRAAECFLDGEPRGQLTDVRFDLATYDSQGTVRIVENAFGYF